MNYRGFAVRCLIGAAALGALTAGAAAQDEKVFKLGVVAFLSGPAAESFGKPAWDGAKTVIDALNAGTVIKPYDQVGFGGLKIEVDLIDEAGGATKQVEELRNAFERDHVDAVLGYISSGDCLAVAPAAQQLKKMLVLMDCGTPRIFEENKFKYVFRSAAHGGMDNIAMARYLVKQGLKVVDVGAINQDYAWGQDSWKDFEGSLAQLEPEAKAKVELWPKLFAGQYGTEISTLLQAAPRGLMKDRLVIFSASDHVLQPLGNRMPDGVIVGARGANGQFAEPSPINDWFVAAVAKAHPGVNPVQPHYRGAQGVLAVKTAVEKAMAANGGKKPTTEEMAAAMVGQEWDAPSGHIKLALGDGHQAIQSNAAGRTKWDADAKMIKLVDIVHFAAECVNPPPGIKSADWIAEGFTGAKCN